MRRTSALPTARHGRRSRKTLTVAAAVTAGAALAALGTAYATSDPAADADAAPRAPAGPVGYGAGTTGGEGGETVTVSDAAGFTEAVQSDGPLVVKVDGTIELSEMTKVAGDKTVVGVGTAGKITGSGLNVSGVQNVIIQNLTFSGSNDDGINVQESSKVWLDHNDISGAKDGGLDIKRGSTDITVSWNHAHDQDKNMLLGHSDDNGSQDTGKLKVTYDHNWFDGTNQRNPRVRFGNPVHVLNNYFSDIGSYGVASTQDAGVLVEGNYFENTEDPFHRGEGDSGPGGLVAKDNHLENSGEGQSGGDVAAIPYDYTAEPATAVKDSVTKGAGVGKL
ncbi:polysaccharide lyase family 1 protein [Streptomyces sp. TRM68367]|uniref:pectate lyase family protein n=1 Tax=Streptomyces sp. TRM68367 TaxID=2758415 RepID=UPI00165A65F6|nr:right-handed parallel beta-helix repeat-containing protein [Streptomyces sp. TRM68367]MBC9728031.1 right-handed parallel beta-helix repeat-containing protein [Streptomyces sp. TRM68367]